MHRKLKALILAVLTLFAVAAPALAETTITFGMWDENQYPYYQELMKMFMAQNPDIKVEIQLTPWNEYWTKLDAAAGAKNDPDTYWMNINMPKYAEAGVLERLDGWIEKDGVNMADWSEGAVSMYNYKGTQWALPINADSVVVAFNKALFDKYGVAHPAEGWTWGDMVATGAQLRDAIAKAGGGEYPLVMELDGQPSYYQFITQEGVNLFGTEGKKSGWAEPGTVKAFEDVLGLMDEKIMPENMVLSDTKGTDLFISAKACMVYIGSWKATVLENSSIAGDIGLVPMPAKQNNKCAVGGIAYALSANSQNKEEGWQLLKYLGGQEAMEYLSSNGVCLPTFIAAQKSYAPQFKNIPGEVFVQQANISAPYPWVPLSSQWNSDETEIVTGIFNRDITPEEGCNRIAGIIEEVMAENQ
ncbi:ABC transporter substrate-binding protein [Bacillota bacterium Meth-B3]